MLRSLRLVGQGRRVHRFTRPRRRCPLFVERLEDRRLLNGGYVQTNLISDIPGEANTTDPNMPPRLVNPWGMAYGGTGPIWVSDNNGGASTIYNGNTGQPSSLVVSIPAPDGTPFAGTPTGIVFNGNGGFNVSEGGNTGSSFFIFATEDGTIAGWAPSVDFHNAIIAVNNSNTPPGVGAVYKGLAMNPTGTLLYATNFRAETIDVFAPDWSPVTLSGSFSDPMIPSGFAPFGIRNIGNFLYVTYAKQDVFKHDDVAGMGLGFVDKFDLNGVLQQHLIQHGQLNSP
jgi:uncharacterized protein (TIGR03118 family)